MRSARPFLCSLALASILMLPNSGRAQQWTGIISPSRAADWSTAGVVGDIPSGSWTNCTTAACNTLFGGSVTATTILNAISSAPANTVVRIPAGTFSVGAFDITKSNVVLRGAGADQTKLNMTSCNSGGGLGGSNCPTIHLMSGATGTGHFGGVTTANWTAGYAQGTTVITLSSTTGLVAGPVGTGSLIMLDQSDDASDGWPAAGDIYSCASATNNCSNQGGNNYARPGRAQVQVVTVTAINGNQVTITPGLAYPNWRSSQSPGAYWNNGLPLHNAGIENLTVDFTAAGQGIYVMNAANVWVLGNRVIVNGVSTSETYHLFAFQSAHVTFRSNYFYGRPGASCGNFPLANYVYSDQEVSDALIENNVGDTNVDFLIPNDPAGRNVFAYNFVTNGVIGVAGSQMHSGNHMMSLWEGNNIASFMGDVTHGSHHFITLFRNHFDGTAHNNSCTTGFAMGILTNNRFFNAIGNVAGASSYTEYETNLGSNSNSNSIFNLGWNGNNSGTPVTTDTNVKRTLMRWGNWDQFTSSNPTGTIDLTGIRWVSVEVPTAITNFANALPVAQALPASFYLSSKPAWFGSVPFPPIGPDVASGNAPNTASAPTGGHANKIPARACFESLANDPAYPSSSPRIKLFSAATCYSSVVASGPPPPTNLNAVVQ